MFTRPVAGQLTGENGVESIPVCMFNSKNYELLRIVASLDRIIDAALLLLGFLDDHKKIMISVMRTGCDYIRGVLIVTPRSTQEGDDR